MFGKNVFVFRSLKSNERNENFCYYSVSLGTSIGFPALKGVILSQLLPAKIVPRKGYKQQS